ncbi:cellulase family glycosylhydrolase [Bradyrhizobium symbiodeficiens]|uniref:cellulase family glycosylhydrolase n=1 Tax=Bradyrhizobium symbiodeficiens TaxID=1404367 RepID=UPI0030CB17D0
MERRARTLARGNLLRLAGLISSLVLSVPACAQHAQPLDARFLLGVGTHQGLGGPVSARGYVPAENVAQIKQLGFNAFRDDFPWSDFEVGGRRMGFTPRLGRLEAQVKSGVARPLLILAFGHHLVPNSSPPTTDEARQRFADYAAAAAQSVVAQHPLFELWNEWNLASKKDASFSPENYLALAQVARPAVKRVAPNAPFLVGALGDDPGWTWTEKMLRTGILQHADGASIHLYNFCMGPSKRTSAEIIERLTAFHRLVAQASGNPDFPIYVTETGWTTASNKCGVSEQAQADNTAQLILWASTATRWLRGMWLYELKDSGKNPSELEDNFGLYRFDNSPKPVACAAQGAWAFIRPTLGSERRELASGVVSINASTNSGSRIAVWSEAPDRHYEIRLKGDQQGASFAMPCDQTAKPASGVWIPVSSTPVLIAANDSAVPALEIRPAR